MYSYSSPLTVLIFIVKFVGDKNVVVKFVGNVIVVVNIIIITIAVKCFVIKSPIGVVYLHVFFCYE